MSHQGKNNKNVANYINYNVPSSSEKSKEDILYEHVIKLSEDFGRMRSDIDNLKATVDKIEPSYTKLVNSESNRKNFWSIVVIVGTIATVLLGILQFFKK